MGLREKKVRKEEVKKLGRGGEKRGRVAERETGDDDAMAKAAGCEPAPDGHTRRQAALLTAPLVVGLLLDPATGIASKDEPTSLVVDKNQDGERQGD